MIETERIDVPTLKPEVKIDNEARDKLLNQMQEEAQVIVHCSFTGRMQNDKIRVWKSTYLYTKDSSHKSELILAENITMYPTWMYINKGQTINFTLIFSGLPKHCKHFDLIENIPEPGGFAFLNIERNNSDVYSLEII
ncbi:MAG: hypothetical protein IPL42_17445 [Saprospiraceae bacterium]|nr:hypothetical protein [Saprospiraceae bacterium]